MPLGGLDCVRVNTCLMAFEGLIMIYGLVSVAFTLKTLVPRKDT